MIPSIHTIALSGFMGCGKTVLGRTLAQALGYAFADTDELLHQMTGMTLQEMFAAGGEAFFRDKEHEAVQLAARLERTVVSTGGGVVTFPRNAELLRASAFIVYVHRDFDACYDAVSRRENRPLAGQKSREELRALYEARLPIYRSCADFTLVNAGTPEEAIAPLLAHLLHKA